MRIIALLLVALLAAGARAQPAGRPPVRSAAAPAQAAPQQEPTRRYLWRLWQLEQERLGICDTAVARSLFPLLGANPPETAREAQQRRTFVHQQMRSSIRELSAFLAKVDRETPSVPARCRTLQQSFRYFVAVDLAETQRILDLDQAGRSWEIKRLDRPNPGKLACAQANRDLSEVFRLQGVPQTFTFAEKGYGE
jgi:hypothetical protein